MYVDILNIDRLVHTVYNLRAGRFHHSDPSGAHALVTSKSSGTHFTKRVCRFYNLLPERPNDRN